VSSKRKLHLPL